MQRTLLGRVVVLAALGFSACGDEVDQADSLVNGARSLEGSTDVAADDFSSGSLDGGTGQWLEAWSTTPELVSVRGTEYLRIRKQGVAERQFETPTTDKLIVSFRARVGGYYLGGDALSVYAGPSGGSWTLLGVVSLARHERSSYQFESYEFHLPDVTGGDFQIRFSGHGDRWWDRVDIDDLVIAVQTNPCDPELTACGEVCVDTTSDPAHCGACDNTCAAEEVCDNGTCTADLCPQPAVGEPGSTCVVSADCDSALGAGDGLCLAGGNPAWPATGYCVIANCTTDADCPGTSACIDIDSSSTAQSLFCLPTCCDDGTCSDGQLCNERLFDIALDQTACFPGSAAAADGDPCASNGDCNVHSFCRGDNFESPGGYCLTTGCTIGDDTTCAPGGDGVCVDDQGDTTSVPNCFDGCTADADCRQSEGYQCFDDGNGNSYCRHPKVGDNCSADADCGNAPWSCRTDYPGGHCTVAPCVLGQPASCPAQSRCFDPDGAGGDAPFCHNECNIGDPASCPPNYTCTPNPDRDICLPTATNP